MPGTEVPGIVVRADWSGPGSAGRLLLLGQLLAGLLVDRLHAELDLAPVVEADDLDLDLVALLEDVGDLLHPIGLHLRNVDEVVAGAEEVHEGAEVDDLHDLRSEERRGGKECVSTGRTRGSPWLEKKK